MDTILSIQVTEAYIFIVKTDLHEQAYLLAVPLTAVWSLTVEPGDVVALQSMDNLVLEIPLSSKLPIGRDVKTSSNKDKMLEGPGELETTISIVACMHTDEIYEAQLHFSMWKIVIRAPVGTQAPVLVSHKSMCGDFDVDPNPLYSSIRMSNMTRSGRFVVEPRDVWGSRHLFSSSCSRIRSGDNRLIPIEIPCSGDLLNIDRIVFDEISGDIYWTCFSHVSFVLTRY